MKYYKVSYLADPEILNPKTQTVRQPGGSSQQPALQANRFLTKNIPTVQKDLAFADFTPADLTECYLEINSQR